MSETLHVVKKFYANKLRCSAREADYSGYECKVEKDGKWKTLKPEKGYYGYSLKLDLPNVMDIKSPWEGNVFDITFPRDAVLSN